MQGNKEGSSFNRSEYVVSCCCSCWCMTIAILTQLLAHVAQMWGWQGQQGAQAACTYVNIPGLHQRLRSADTTHVLVALAIIGCFMLFKIS